MSVKTNIKKPLYSFLPTDIEGFDALVELTLDMRWSWDHGADEIWRKLDPGSLGSYTESIGCSANSFP